jgi:large conductance mechanosensitive channel
MKKFFSEFKAFITKGNVIDLAVGVIIGGAFQAIVSSFTGDIISPLLGLLVNNDFSALVATVGDVEIRYGAFITAVINFILMALVIFFFLKAIRGAGKVGKKKKEEVPAAAPTTKVCPYCRSEIALEATRCPHCTSEL